MAQLKAAKERLGHLSPEVREAEEAAIEEQIRELESGESVGELGGELRRVK